MNHASRDDVLAWDRTHVWRPYTPIDRHEQGPPPPVIRRAEHVWLHTDDGRTLIDGVGSWWVSNLGHGHPRVRAAVHEQLDRMAHVAMAGLAHEEGARLAKRLADITPDGLTRAFYSDNGSTAVEVAVRAAFQFWRQNGAPERRLFLSFDGAYHGDTIGTVSVGGIPTFHDTFGPLLFETVRAPAPPEQPDFEDAAFAALEQALEPRASEVAAVVVEPLVQGAAGMRMHSPAWLRRVRALCDAHGVLLIADEVFVGFGRTGTLFACEQAGITPDFLCLSKGLTAGFMPFAATMTTERIYDGFRGGPERTFFYGHSYCGNPLGCAAAHAVLDAFEQDDVLGNVAARGAQLDAWLARVATRDHVAHVRRTGLVAAVQFAEGDRSNYLARTGWNVYEEALRRGAYLRPLGNVTYFVPALTIRETELAGLLEIADASIEAALSPPR